MAARYFNAFRIASYLLILYALGHTLGAVVGTPRFGVASDAVVALMKSVHVKAQAADCSWYGFYRGFGALVSIYFVFSAFVAWRLGGARGQVDRALLPLGWALFLSHLAGVVITVAYFFPVPIAFSTAVAAALGYGCVRARVLAARLSNG